MPAATDPAARQRVPWVRRHAQVPQVAAYDQAQGFTLVREEQRTHARLYMQVRKAQRLSFEVKYGAQRDVDLHELLRVQAAREVTEALRVDGSGLLNQYPGILAEELDGGMDHGSEGLGRRWGHKPR